MRCASLADKKSSTLKSLTSPAIWEANALGSNLVMRLMPDCPAMMFFHAVAVPIPTGDTTPRPVTTTLRFVILEISPLTRADKSEIYLRLALT